jgi:hypothetical protein
MPAMKPGFLDYLKAAFNARPMGMVVPPNWVALAAAAMLGLLNPGVWVLGAGFELLYLFSLTNNGRFRRLVEGGKLAEAARGAQTQIETLVAQLDAGSRERYRALERRCQAILKGQSSELAGSAAAQAEGLGRLLWIYLRLLRTRQAMNRALLESAGPGGETLEARIARLERQLGSGRVHDDLRKSLSGQIEILQQRLEKQREARSRLAFLEAELTRIQEQVELIREQAVLSTDPEALSHRIDEVAATLSGTTQWIQDQQQLFGETEDLLTDPPPLALQAAAKEAE